MPGALKSIDADGVHPHALRRDGMADRDAFVNDFDAGGLHCRPELLCSHPGRLDDVDAAGHYRVDVRAIGRRRNGRKNRHVDGEWFLRHRSAPIDLLRQCVWRGLRQTGQGPKSSGIGHRRREFGAPHPLHTALDDRKPDSEQVGHAGTHRGKGRNRCHCIYALNTGSELRCKRHPIDGGLAVERDEEGCNLARDGQY
jgi:hypothetical protein